MIWFSRRVRAYARLDLALCPLFTVLFFLTPNVKAAEHWQIQYFYDHDDEDLRIVDLAFISPQRGLAAGWILQGNNSRRPAGLITADGGRSWQAVKLPDLPSSLFLLSDGSGWLAGPKGIWHTSELGRNWRKVGGIRGIHRLYFLDAQRGWAVGEQKSAYATQDGGRTWKRLDAADEPKTGKSTTVYDAISFAGERLGIIAGWSKPARSQERFPEWMDPRDQRREWPGTGITLETRDGGRTWKAEQVSMFGRITDLCIAADGRGLGLIEFFDRFEYPSEVFRLDVRTGVSGRVFRRNDRAVTDVLLYPKGSAYLAAIEPPGRLFHSPVPGKLKILKSDDLSNWTEMQVDYRAIARRAVLAEAGPGNLWVATDTGMILRLVPE